MEKAAQTLSHARPTTQERMISVVEASLSTLKEALNKDAPGEDLPRILFEHALESINANYTKYISIGNYLAAQIPCGGTVMTQCFAETIIGMMLRSCREQGKTIKCICPETRPYLQGARLTASVISDMDFEVHVITDNMPAYIIGEKKVDVFTSAADVITMDGHIVNKIGTFQIALAAHHYGIPYFATGTPNQKHPGMDSVKIEERDSDQVLCFMGERLTKPKVQAYYPAFDITPPHLCSGVVTNKGIFSPFDLPRYFRADKAE
jgi:methylthioribose-1-phosphate isomerase